MAMKKRQLHVATDPKLRTVSNPDLLVHGSDAPFRRMLHTLLAIGNTFDALRVGFSRITGVSPPQHEILMLVYRENDGLGISVGELAALVQLTSAFIATETNKLSAAGFIEKVPDTVDRRRVILRVTEYGLKRLAFLSGFQRQVNDVMFECFDAKEFRKFSKYLDEVLPCAERAAKLVATFSDASEVGELNVNQASRKSPSSARVAKSRSAIRSSAPARVS
jgi:DNA-binding MarR family transcriptional regulator